jgi:Tfp pilus assembly protein PilN
MKPLKDYINLLPQEEKKPSLFARRDFQLVLVFVVVWLGLFGQQVWKYWSLHDRLTPLDAQKQVLQQQADFLRKELAVVSPTGMTKDKASLIQDILKERVTWSAVFKHLSVIVPKGLWFDYLEGIADGKAEIKIKGGAFNYFSISDLMLTMERSGYFENPQLSYAQKVIVQGQDVVGFEIICGINKEQGER